MLATLFDDEDNGATLLEAVERDFRERNYMAPGTVSAGWRHERLLYRLKLPRSGWFVDIERAESIAAISDALGIDLATKEKLDVLTTAHLRGENRNLTTSIAEWVRSQVLEDGSLPHGICFGSKHDSKWTCWAIWLRAVDDGKPITSEPTRSDSGAEIKDYHHNRPLAQVMDLFRLKGF